MEKKYNVIVSGLIKGWLTMREIKKYAKMGCKIKYVEENDHEK